MAELSPQTFGTNVVRRKWYQDTWYYSVIDVVAVVMESVNPNRALKRLAVRPSLTPPENEATNIPASETAKTPNDLDAPTQLPLFLDPL